MDVIFDTLLEPLRRLLAWVMDFLEGTLNITPSVFAMQLIALVLFVAGLVIALKYREAAEKAEPKEFARYWWGLSVVVCGIIVVAIAVDWTVQAVFPVPGKVEGSIALQSDPGHAASRLFETRVHLVDFRNRQILGTTLGPDTETGRFEITFNPEFSNPPRKMVATSICCDSVARPVSRRELRSGIPFPLTLVPR